MCTFVNFRLNDGLPVLSGPVRGSIASLGENPSLYVSSLSVKSQVPALLHYRQILYRLSYKGSPDCD